MLPGWDRIICTMYQQLHGPCCWFCTVHIYPAQQVTTATYCSIYLHKMIYSTIYIVSCARCVLSPTSLSLVSFVPVPFPYHTRVICTASMNKATHPLGRISEPILSKTCLRGGTHIENGGYGKRDIFMDASILCLRSARLQKNQP